MRFEEIRAITFLDHFVNNRKKNNFANELIKIIVIQGKHIYFRLSSSIEPNQAKNSSFFLSFLLLIFSMLSVTLDPNLGTKNPELNLVLSLEITYRNLYI